MKTKPLTPNMQALLEFIEKRHAQTGAPVTERDIALAGVVPARYRCTASVGLLDRGLIRVPQVGTAAWLPVEATR